MAEGIDIKFLEPLNMVRCTLAALGEFSTWGALPLRYLPGQFFNEHHDGRFRSSLTDESQDASNHLSPAVQRPQDNLHLPQ